MVDDFDDLTSDHTTLRLIVMYAGLSDGVDLARNCVQKWSLCELQFSDIQDSATSKTQCQEILEFLTILRHAFACRWEYQGRRVCWITQLVVDRRYRERGLAMQILLLLRQDNDAIYGILSSHAAACLAAAKPCN